MALKLRDGLSQLSCLYVEGDYITHTFYLKISVNVLGSVSQIPKALLHFMLSITDLSILFLGVLEITTYYYYY